MPTQMPSSGATGGDAFEQRLVEATVAQALRGTGRVAYPGNDGERCAGDIGWVRADDGRGPGARQRRADAAQVAGAVVSQYDSHSPPFVEPPCADRAGLAERAPHRLERRLGDVVVVARLLPRRAG